MNLKTGSDVIGHVMPGYIVGSSEGGFVASSASEAAQGGRGGSLARLLLSSSVMYLAVGTWESSKDPACRTLEGRTRAASELLSRTHCREVRRGNLQRLISVLDQKAAH